MYRKELIDILLNNPLSIKDIAQLLELPVKDVEEDVRHLQKSIKHMEYHLEVIPARCHKCNFLFSKDKLHKPSKCPNCHSTWIYEPRISVVQNK